jgi:F-type H+-transporting ATPase subunit b
MTLPITSLTGMLALSEEASETQETINPVLPVGFEIFWSAVFFFTLLALMRYVLLPPIQQGREERAARLSAGRDSVSDSDSELAQILAAHKEQIAVAEANVPKLLVPSKKRSRSCAQMRKPRLTLLVRPLSPELKVRSLS